MQIRDIALSEVESLDLTIKETKQEISPGTLNELSQSRSEDFSSTIKTLRQISADFPKSLSLDSVVPAPSSSSNVTPMTKPDAYEAFLRSEKYAELESNGFKQLFCIPINDLNVNETDPVRRGQLEKIKGKLNAHIANLGSEVIGTPPTFNAPGIMTSMVLFSKGDQLYRVSHREIVNGVSTNFSRVKPIPYEGANAVVYVMIAKKLPNMPGFQIIVRHQAPNNAEIIKEDFKRYEQKGEPLRATPASGHPGLFNKLDEPVTLCLGAGEKYSIETKIVLLNNKTGSLHSNFSSVLTSEEQKLLADTIFGHTYRKNMPDRRDGHYHIASAISGQCEKELFADLEFLDFVKDFYTINSKVASEKLSLLTTVPGVLSSQSIFSGTSSAPSSTVGMTPSVSETENKVSTATSSQTSGNSESAIRGGKP